MIFYSIKVFEKDLILVGRGDENSLGLSDGWALPIQLSDKAYEIF